MKNFYVIEGNDGVGKTTMAKELCYKIGGEYIRTPGEEYSRILDHVWNNTSAHARFYYFVSSLFDASQRISKKLESTNVVCDRYLGSTILNYLATANLKMSDMVDQYFSIRGNLLMPHRTILLQCDYDERMRRIMKRNNGVAGRDATNRSFSKKIDQSYMQLMNIEDSWSIIDTTSKSIDTIVNEGDKII